MVADPGIPWCEEAKRPRDITYKTKKRKKKKKKTTPNPKGEGKQPFRLSRNPPSWETEVARKRSLMRAGSQCSRCYQYYTQRHVGSHFRFHLSGLQCVAKTTLHLPASWNTQPNPIYRTTLQQQPLRVEAKKTGMAWVVSLGLTFSSAVSIGLSASVWRAH